MTLKSGIAIGGLAIVFAALLIGDAATVGVGWLGRTPRPAWQEVKWPFRLDEWGLGRAFRCAPSDCGAEINLYLRAKVGFCNCTTGVSDDGDLDRVGDLGLFSDSFAGLTDGRPVSVGSMKGRSRSYRVAIPYAPPREMVAIGFNDQCDVAVATVVAGSDQLTGAEDRALEFLNTDLVLRWAAAELGRSGI